MLPYILSLTGCIDLPKKMLPVKTQINIAKNKEKTNFSTKYGKTMVHLGSAAHKKAKGEYDHRTIGIEAKYFLPKKMLSGLISM